MWQKKELRLLVVDEQLDYFELLSECAELSKHQVPIVCMHAVSGSEAIKIINNWQPSVVLVDLHNSEADGFEILKLCNEGLTRAIVTSERQSVEAEKSALQSGASCYFTKSCDPEEIDNLFAQIEALSDLASHLH